MPSGQFQQAGPTVGSPKGAEFESPGRSPASGLSPDAGRSPGLIGRVKTKPQRGATLTSTISESGHHVIVPVGTLNGMVSLERANNVVRVLPSGVAPRWGSTVVAAEPYPGLRRASGRCPGARLHPGLSNSAPLGLSPRRWNREAKLWVRPRPLTQLVMPPKAGMVRSRWSHP